MTEIIHYVKTTESGLEIWESFIDFFIISDKRDFGFTEEIFKMIVNDDLNMMNCRGRSYDNGSQYVWYL